MSVDRRSRRLPAVFSGSRRRAAPPRDRRFAVYTERGADEEELSRRIGDAEIVVNIERTRGSPLGSWPRALACGSSPSGAPAPTTWTWRPARRAASRDQHSVASTRTPSPSTRVALMLAVTRRIPAMDAACAPASGRAHSSSSSRVRRWGWSGSAPSGVASRAGRAVRHATPRIDLAVPTRGAPPPPAPAVPHRDAAPRIGRRESAHLRLSAETRGYLGRDRLALMKPTAFLVNTARAQLVDETRSSTRCRRRIAAPRSTSSTRSRSAGDPLAALPNVVFTPHNAGMTREVIDAGLVRAVENVEQFLGGAARRRWSRHHADSRDSAPARTD